MYWELYNCIDSSRHLNETRQRYIAYSALKPWTTRLVLAIVVVSRLGQTQPAPCSRGVRPYAYCSKVAAIVTRHHRAHYRKTIRKTESTRPQKQTSRSGVLLNCFFILHSQFGCEVLRYLFVWVSASISQKSDVQTSPNFHSMYSATVARSRPWFWKLVLHIVFRFCGLGLHNGRQ